MNEAIIDKYISNTASEEEIQAVRAYLPATSRLLLKTYLIRKSGHICQS